PIAVRSEPTAQRADWSAGPEHAPQNGAAALSSIAGRGVGACDFEAALKAVDGDAQLLSDLARIFLSESPRLIGDLEEAIQHVNAPLLRRAAHTIKGGLRLFGAASAYELALRIEELGHEGDVSSAEADFENLKRAVAQVHRELFTLSEASL